MAALPVGCYSAGTDDEPCTVGTQVMCFCANGDPGTRTCSSDGNYEECSCQGAAGSSNGGSSSGTGGVIVERGGTSSGGETSGGATAGGSAGSTSAGSGGTGGSGGTVSGGSGGGPPACNPQPGPVKGDGVDLTIDDLDDDNLMFLTAGVGMGAWDFSKDAGGAGTITPPGTATLIPVDGGQTGTALHVQGSGLTGWGAALGAFLNGPTSSFDASAYAGIAFYIKGTSAVHEGQDMVMVMARMPDVLPGAGSCCNDTVLGSECYSAHRTVIPITGVWTEVVLYWADFIGPAWGLGSTLSFNPNRIRDITFIFNHDVTAGEEAASFDVWIDGLSFEPN